MTVRPQAGPGPGPGDPPAAAGPARWGWRHILPPSVALALVAYLVNEWLGVLPGWSLPGLRR